MTLFIVLDFDGTITEEDTVDSLARFAVYYAPTDSCSTTPTQDWPPPNSHLPSPMLSALIDDLVSDKVVFRLNPATEDKPSPVEENEHPIREDDTTISETTPPQPSPGIYIVKSFSDLTLSTSPQPPSPSASVKSFSGLTLSASIKSPAPSFISSTSLLDIWNFTLVEGYIRDVQKFESEYTPSEDERLKWEDEEEFLEQLNAVELESMKRVESSPLFRGLVDSDFRNFGREAVRIGAKGADTRPLVGSRPGPRGVELRPVKLRKGFNEFVRQASLDQWKLGLVSINWSQAFIQGVLDASNENSDPPVGPFDDEDPDEDMTGNDNNDNKNGSQPATEMDLDQSGAEMDLDENDADGSSDEDMTSSTNNDTKNSSRPSIEMDLDESDTDSDLTRVVGELRLDNNRENFTRIVANHISSDGNIEGPPTWTRPIVTAKDKETAFWGLRDEVGGWEKSVYIGDSRTDLLCLRAADLGIAIASYPDRSGLLKNLRRLAGDIPHVSEATMIPGTKLVWARNFEEILQSKILDGLSKEGE